MRPSGILTRYIINTRRLSGFAIRHFTYTSNDFNSHAQPTPSVLIFIILSSRWGPIKWKPRYNRRQKKRETEFFFFHFFSSAKRRKFSCLVFCINLEPLFFQLKEKEETPSDLPRLSFRPFSYENHFDGKYLK